MPLETNSDVVVTNQDRELARDAMVEGFNNCQLTNKIGTFGKQCACDLSVIDGCKARVEAIAKTIATVRRM